MLVEYLLFLSTELKNVGLLISLQSFGYGITQATWDSGHRAVSGTQEDFSCNPFKGRFRRSSFGDIEEDDGRVQRFFGFKLSTDPGDGGLTIGGGGDAAPCERHACICPSDR